ncbi:class I SAM-dependent methyltransferase [Occallatibacter savannae]|uniref:class I SAM-dependent methyltransferase n=1 Tax=Occallatibacter savannae TaxID=1002691 RepID=UPI000D6934C9|nr:class I SAM-dependent methyltransferase [Occallatibacter savannae]
MDYREYFTLRRQSSEFYASFELPPYLYPVLKEIDDPRILDFGCGFGQMLRALARAGLREIEGIDIEPEAIEFCRSQGLKCTNSFEQPGFFEEHSASFDFVIMSHVLEHFPKEKMIEHLRQIRNLLRPGGALILMVPNAQANTGCYWAFEDFTHHFLFTSGSLFYVLRAAGFNDVEFLDIDCTSGLPVWKRAAQRFFLRLYAANYNFWNKITGSAFHHSSPLIFSYEIKAVARV